MAIETGTYTRYDAKGLREQLADVIYNISPEDTPVLTRSGKMAAKQTLFEWQTDALTAAVTTNAQLEGDDITTFPSLNPSVRVGNYTQISRKLIILSDTLEVVDKAGRKSELAYQIAKNGAELKRDQEATLLNPQGGTAGSTTTARTTATLLAWVKTNVDYYTTDGGNPAWTSGVPSAARTDGGTLRALTQTIFDNVLQLCWTAGANPTDVYAGPVNKKKISGFTGIATPMLDVARIAPTASINAIDVYVGDFNTVRVAADRFQRERDVWFLDFDYLAIANLRPYRTVDLAKTGDAEKRMLLVEWGLQCKTESALGLAADLTTT